MVNLLAVGNDPTSALPPDEVMGDTYQRQLQYASILGQYHLITRSPSRPVPECIPLADNFWVYPCGHRNMVDYMPAAIRTGWQVVRQHKVDVVSTQDPFLTGLAGWAIARRFGLPLSLQFVASAVDDPYWLQEKRVNLFLNRLAHWLIRRAHTFRVVSESERQKLVRLGVPVDRIWNLPSITDFARFLHVDGSALRQEFLGGSFDKLVLLIARLAPQKDISTLLRAMVLLRGEQRSVLMLVVGSGPLEPVLRREVAQMGLQDHVRFVGMVPYGQLPTYYAACDVLALSSVYEGNPRVLAEAAVSARPAISTDVSGAKDTIVDGQTGFVVPIGDHRAMSERLTLVLSDPHRAKEMGQRARQHVQSLYDSQRLLAGFRDLWETTARVKG
jgi:glycosyltransferase involved in cell wall biosynthesis